MRNDAAVRRPRIAGDIAVAWRAAISTMDIALLIDRDGVVLDHAVKARSLAPGLAGRVDWEGQHWSRIVTAASHPAMERVLAAEPSATGHLVAHRVDGGPRMPVLYQGLRPAADGPSIALGRDLLGCDFATLVQQQDLPVIQAYLAGLRDRGMGAEALCLDVLAPAARRLGELWAEDHCDFVEVTEGVWQLHLALRDITPPEPRIDGPLGARALLATAPGEQHAFGLQMVATFFRWAGWDVHMPDLDGGDAPADMVARARFAVVGFSLAKRAEMPALAAIIRAVRAASCNPDLLVLVGGKVFADAPELAAVAGADAAARDARHAVQLANAAVAAAEAAQTGNLHRRAQG